MQDLWIFPPLGHSSKQDMMAYVVKVALKVYVDDLGKPLHQPMHDPIQCLVCRAPGPVSKGAWIKVRFKDRLQDQLYCPLNNPISDGGNSEPAFSAPIRPLVAGRFRPGIPKHSGHLLRSIPATPIVGVKSS